MKVRNALLAGFLINAMSILVLALGGTSALARIGGGIGLSMGLTLSILALLLYRWQGTLSQAPATVDQASAHAAQARSDERALAG